MNAKYGAIFILLAVLILGGCFITEHMVARLLIAYTAFSFLVCGLSYALKSPRFWQKNENGTIDPIGLLLFAPLHALNWLSLLLAVWLQKEKPFHEIVPHLWLGRRLLHNEATYFSHSPEAAILDLTAEFAENRKLRNKNYLCIPTLDHTAPRKEHLESAMTFIEKHILARPVFVHCALGHGRSTTVVAAWLLAQNKAQDVETAIKQIKAIRPGIGLNVSQIAALREFIGNT
jgi:protein-tyrosine phosphatase